MRALELFCACASAIILCALEKFPASARVSARVFRKFLRIQRALENFGAVFALRTSSAVAGNSALYTVVGSINYILVIFKNFFSNNIFVAGAYKKIRNLLAFFDRL